MGFGRLALWEVLEYLHNSYRPLEPTTWADDLGHQEVGHERTVVRRTVQVSAELVTRVTGVGFKMSPKSTLLSSSTRLSQEIQEALTRQGIQVQTVAGARDLGIDGHARRRSTKTMQERLKRASRKAEVFKRRQDR